jgi:hypothetical protein
MFYQINVNEEISVLNVGDTTHPFVPLPLNKLSYQLQDERERLDLLIDKVYNMHTIETIGNKHKKYVNQICLGAAISACSQMLQDNGRSQSVLMLV